MDKQNISEIISKTFDARLGFMRPKYQYHYAMCRFRIQNDSEYINPMLVDFQIKTLRWYPRLYKMLVSDFAHKEGQRLYLAMSSQTEKKKRRKEIYREFPETLFYTRMLFYLFQIKSYQLDQVEGFSEIWEDVIKHLSGIDFGEMLFREDLIRESPSTVANKVFYLKYLGVCDHTEKLNKIFEAYWGNKDPKDIVSIKNKIYGLTHIIIAASNYYQNLVDRKDYDWCLKYFEEKIETIIENTNMDIIAEVGLCFCLCGLSTHQVVQKCREHIISKFDYEKGVVPREDGSDSFEKLEHRNSLIMLLFSNFEKLYSGPNMKIYMRERGRELFLPEKGKFIGVEKP